jgi:hypothetical protein
MNLIRALAVAIAALVVIGLVTGRRIGFPIGGIIVALIALVLFLLVRDLLKPAS